MRVSFQINWPIRVFAIVTALCASTGVVAQHANRAQDVVSPISLTISAEEPSLPSGSLVWVDVTMENTSDHDISEYVENAGDQGGFVYKVSVWDETGSAAPETKFGRRIQNHDTIEEREQEPYVIITSGAESTLKRGQKKTDRVNISRLYDIIRPGTYSIQVLRFEEESKTAVVSNKVTITVTQ